MRSLTRAFQPGLWWCASWPRFQSGRSILCKRHQSSVWKRHRSLRNTFQGCSHHPIHGSQNQYSQNENLNVQYAKSNTVYLSPTRWNWGGGRIQAPRIYDWRQRKQLERSSTLEWHTRAKVFAQLKSCLWWKRQIQLQKKKDSESTMHSSDQFSFLEVRLWRWEHPRYMIWKVFDHSCLWRILSAILTDRMTNDDILWTCSQRLDIESVIKTLCAGKGTSKTNHRKRWSKRPSLPASPQLDEMFPQRGQRKTWLTCVKAYFNRFGRLWDKNWLDIT